MHIRKHAQDSVVQIKAKRRKISTEQLELLCALFEQTESPSYGMREEVGAKVGMTNREVQVWFQNRRARKIRLEAQGRHDEVHTVSSAPGSAKAHSRGSPSPPSESMTSQTFAFRIPAPLQPRKKAHVEEHASPGPAQSPFVSYGSRFANRIMPGSPAPPPAYHLRRAFDGPPRYYSPAAFSPASPGYIYSPTIPSPALSTSSSCSRQTMNSPFTPATSAAGLSPNVHVHKLSLNSETEQRKASDYFAAKAKVDAGDEAPPMANDSLAPLRPAHKRSQSDTVMTTHMRLPSLHHILNPAPVRSAQPWPQHSPGDSPMPSEHYHQWMMASQFGPVRRVQLRHQYDVHMSPHHQHAAMYGQQRSPQLPMSQARGTRSPARSPARSTTKVREVIPSAALGLGFIKVDESTAHEDGEEGKKTEAYRRASVDWHANALRSVAAATGAETTQAASPAVHEQ